MSHYGLHQLVHEKDLMSRIFFGGHVKDNDAFLQAVKHVAVLLVLKKLYALGHARKGGLLVKVDAKNHYDSDCYLNDYVEYNVKPRLITLAVAKDDNHVQKHYVGHRKDHCEVEIGSTYLHQGLRDQHNHSRKHRYEDAQDG